MNINRDNYESHFMDYLDGRLTSKEARELYAFLLVNDDLREQLEDLEEIRLHPPKIKYENHLLLKKDELHACTDYYAIATAENSLSPEDIKFLEKHPDHQKNGEIYRQIKLKPDLNIHFERKTKLYRTTSPWSVAKHITAIAAMLCLLIGIAYILSRHTPKEHLAMGNSMYLPPVPEVKQDDILIKQPDRKAANRISKTNLTNDKTNKKIPVLKKDTQIPEVISLPIQRLASISPDYSLITAPKRIDISESEIYLAKAATNWKSSERNFLSDNIFNSMINAGKIFAEIIKNKE